VISTPGNNTADKKRRQNKLNRQRATIAVGTELAFISNSEFSQTRLSAKAIAQQLEPLLSATNKVDIGQSAADGRRSAQMIRLCSTPLLSSSDEPELFRLMNYCRYRANAARSTLNPRRPNVRKLDEFESFNELADEIRNHIVSANVRLVVSIVKKFADQKNTFDDLFSEGILSLMRATDKFDYARGFRFSTYATCAIRRELANFAERQARQRKRFASGVGELMQSSLEPQLTESLHPAEHSRLYQQLQNFMTALDNREQMILLARYGFQSEEGRKRTFQNLGDELGVCKERVRQLEARALQKLRSMAGAAGFAPELVR
jgi:RNA polymerase primary sigma factor